MSQGPPFTAPNLFRFASSELSQDAFVGWLLAWADARCEEQDTQLHALGRELLGAMLAKADIAVPAASTIIVQRQWHGVGRAESGALDLLIEIGEGHVLAIEDKTGTEDHSAQLDRYASAVAARYPGRTRALIYLKTGDQSSYDRVLAGGWRLFLRRDLLGVLRKHDGLANDVVREFSTYLTGVDGEVDAWRTTPVTSDWSDRAWRGFFMAVRQSMGAGEWAFVNNASGGFMGFHFGWQSVEGGQLFLHLEEEDLVVKLEVLGPNKTEMRNQWSRRVLEEVEGRPFVRPERFGHGEYMTVARLPGGYRVASADGLVDMAESVRRLRGLADAIRTLTVGG